MGKSIRSKRKKRLRTLKRELVVPHYDHKDIAKYAAQEAAAAAPKVELQTSRSNPEEIGMEEQTRGRTGVTAMSIDESTAVSSAVTGRLLKARGGIKKRGKSQGRLKKERHHKKKLQF